MFFFLFSASLLCFTVNNINIKYLILKGSVPGASVIIIFPFWTFHSCILFSEHNNGSCCWMISAGRFLSSSKIQKKPFYSEIVNPSLCVFSVLRIPAAAKPRPGGSLKCYPFSKVPTAVMQSALSFLVFACLFSEYVFNLARISTPKKARS